MEACSSTPVIFLSFANERVTERRHLRQLSQEARLLRKILGEAEQRGLCEIVVRENAIADDIIDVFQSDRYRQRIASFHFGGHSDGYGLVFESDHGPATADSGGLAELLAQQESLNFVFLNACSTRQQAQKLMIAGVPVVVATSQAVPDNLATEFAGRFYKGIANGADLKSAYGEAASAMKLKYNSRSEAREVILEPEVSFGESLEPSSYWDLLVRPGHRPAIHWNLHEAAKQPLLGLPPLPGGDLPEAPFRHLHRFTEEHARLFFGRGSDIRRLYTHVADFQSAPIVLFSGQSGVGKSSFLEAGLVPRLRSKHIVHYLRRDRSGGLLQTILDSVGEGHHSSIGELWRKVESESGRPLVILLDQVEEVYTRPRPDQRNEVQQFFSEISLLFEIFEERPLGKLVLCFRKEWLADIKKVASEHKLAYDEVFLAPLNRDGMLEAICGPCQDQRLQRKYGIEIEDGLAEIIADDLLHDIDSPLAPTLQLALTKLWESATRDKKGAVCFSTVAYRELKRSGLLLRDFVDQQIAELREKLVRPEERGIELDILAYHTTDLGSAETRSRRELFNQYSGRGDEIERLVRSMVDLKLLTSSDEPTSPTGNCTRLAHDTLGPLVRQSFDNSVQPGQVARRILEGRTRDSGGRVIDSPLTSRELEVVQDGRLGMRSRTADERKLIDASLRLHTLRARLRRMWQGAGLAAVIAIVAFGIIANRSASEARANLAISHWHAGVNLLTSSGKATRAAHSFAKAASSPDPNLASSARLAAVDAVRTATLSRTTDRSSRTDFAALLADPMSVSQTIWLKDDSPSRRWAIVSGTKTVRPGELDILQWDNNGALALFDVATENPVTRIFNHGDTVRGGHFDVGTARILSWSNDGSLSVFNAVLNQKTSQAQHDDRIDGATFNANGSRVLSWSDDGTARLWEADTGRQLLVLTHLPSKKLSPGGVEGAAFSHDESLILTWDMKSVQVWDAQSGKAMFPPLAHETTLIGASFELGSSRILSRSNYVRFWDAASGEELLPSMAHNNWVWGARLSADGSKILSWSFDGTVRLWSTSTGQAVVEPMHYEHKVYGAVFSRDESKVLAWGGRISPNIGSSRIWDAANGLPLTPSLFHGDEVVLAAFSPDERQFMSFSKQSARLWNLSLQSRDGQVMLHNDRVTGARFSNDRTRIISTSADGAIHVWDATDCKPSQIPIRTDAASRRAVLGPKGVSVLIYGKDNVWRLWNLTDRASLEVPIRQNSSGPGKTPVFNRDGTKLLTWSRVGVSLFQLKPEFKKFAEWRDHDLVSAQFTSSEQEVLTLSGNGNIRFIDIGSRTDVSPPISAGYRIRGAALNADESRVLSWGFSGLHVWDVSTGRKIHDMSEHGGNLEGASFSADGRRILGWGLPDRILLWDALSGAPVSAYSVPEHIRTVRFNRDGTQLLTSSTDGTVRLLDVKTGLEIVQPFRHDGPVVDAVFDDDEDRIMSWSSDGTARIWDIFVDSTATPETVKWLVQGRTGTMMSDSLGLQVLQPSEWRAVAEKAAQAWRTNSL